MGTGENDAVARGPYRPRVDRLARVYDERRFLAALAQGAWRGQRRWRPRCADTVRDQGQREAAGCVVWQRHEHLSGGTRVERDWWIVTKLVAMTVVCFLVVAFVFWLL